MTPDDVQFSRVIIGSVLAFTLLAATHFLLPARVAAAMRRFRPVIGVASAGVAIAFDPPLVAKVLLWLVASLYVLLPAAFVILSPLIKRLRKRKRRTRAPSS
jgi:hypothetical protein